MYVYICGCARTHECIYGTLEENTEWLGAVNSSKNKHIELH